jgi:preprotein translocase subunit Sec63
MKNNLVTPTNYYQILGINPNANTEEVKKAFRRLVKYYHPDLNPAANAVEQFHLIHQAYETLSDPAKRSYYDLILTHYKEKSATPKASPTQGNTRQTYTASCPQAAYYRRTAKTQEQILWEARLLKIERLQSLLHIFFLTGTIVFSSLSFVTLTFIILSSAGFNLHTTKGLGYSLHVGIFIVFFVSFKWGAKTIDTKQIYFQNAARYLYEKKEEYEKELANKKIWRYYGFIKQSLKSFISSSLQKPTSRS